MSSNSMSSSTGGIVRSRSRSSALRTLSYTTPSTSLSQSSSAATSVSSAHAVTTSPTISRARSSSASCNGSPKRKVSSRPTFKPPVLSLRNAVLFSDAYSKVVDDHLLHAPTLEQGKAFEMQIAEFLSPQTSATDVQHYCTCQDEQCSRRCVSKRASVIRVAVRWFRYFERVENARGALTDVDFHHKSLVDHVLVTLLVEKGAERRIDSAEAALDANAPPRSAHTPDPFATASNEW